MALNHLRTSARGEKGNTRTPKVFQRHFPSLSPNPLRYQPKFIYSLQINRHPPHLTPTSIIMQSLRRVALRSAASAARVAAPKAPTNQFASQFASSKITVKQSSVSLARYFSQTVRVAAEENNNGAEIAVDHVQPNEPIPETTDVERSTQPVGEQSGIRPRADLPNGVFIRNFVFDVTEGHLSQMFAKFGEVVEARVVRDARGLSKGYGFVFMSSPEEAKTAVAELDGTFWHGRRIGVNERHGSGPEKRQRSGASTPVDPTRFLFIGNIPYEATDAQLNKMFRELENVEDVRVAVDRVTGWPRGFAHADFVDVESAKKAHQKLSGFELNGRPLRCDFAAPPEQEGKRSSGPRRDSKPRREVEDSKEQF